MKMEFKIEAKEYGCYDVLVCGGGTAGVVAAIAAARQGAKTLLVERSFAVGGMLTIGDAGITKFTEHCKDPEVYKKEVIDVLATNPKSVQVVGGITLEYVERMIQQGNALGTSGTAGSYVFTDKCEAQWTLMDMLEEAGVQVLYDTRVCKTLKEENRVTGVLVCNKEGFSTIKASVVIDATGDADVAADAGVPYHLGASERDVELGGAHKVGDFHEFGTMYRVRGVDFERLFSYLEEHPELYKRQPYAIMSLDEVKESYRKGEMCTFDIWPRDIVKKVQVYNLPTSDEAILLAFLDKFTAGGDGLNAESLSRGQKKLHDSVRIANERLKEIPGFESIKTIFVPDVGVRETRHIIGEYVMTGMDAMTGCDFEDSIGCGGHPIDIRPIPPELKDMSMNHWRFHIPYRIMLPKEVDNLLVTGRCVSAERAASGVLRPTAQCMVMGEAAGTAAALAVQNGTSPKQIDVQKLRNILKTNGAIL